MELLNPFEMHTARYSVRVPVDIQRPRKKATDKILKVLKNVTKSNVPRIVPILGEAGYGKTHLYWHLREEIGNNALVVYVPAPSSANQLFAHIYFSILRNYGVGLLQDVSNIITKKFSLEEATTAYPGKGAIIVEFFFALQEASKAKAAKMWLAGNNQSHLGNSKRIFEMNEEIASTALRVILENSPLPFVLFLDEIESCFFTKGEQEELLLLENIKRLYNDTGNFLIVLACVTQIWDKITDLSSVSVQGRIDRPVMLQRFKKEDLQTYVSMIMKKYWVNLGIELGKPDNWPLTIEIIDEVYDNSGGNPRDAIKGLYDWFDERKDLMADDLKITNNLRGRDIETIKSLIDKANIDKLTVGTMTEKAGQFFILSKGKKRVMVWNPNDEVLRENEIKTKVNEFTKEGYQKLIVLKESTEYVPGSVWCDIAESKKIVDEIKSCF